MHNIYKGCCLENNLDAVNRNIFSKILHEEKISIHRPRKDQCNLCFGFKLGNVNEEDYELHIKKKEERRIAKSEAKECANSKRMFITMDLQSVLLCPKILASSAYYKYFAYFNHPYCNPHISTSQLYHLSVK
jgi:hypothetical protein